MRCKHCEGVKHRTACDLLMWQASRSGCAAGLPEVRLPPHITAEHTVGISPEAWEQHLAPRWDGRVLQLLPEELPLPGKVTVRGNAQRKRAKLDFNSACKKLGCAPADSPGRIGAAAMRAAPCTQGGSVLAVCMRPDEPCQHGVCAWWRT